MTDAPPILAYSTNTSDDAVAAAERGRVQRTVACGAGAAGLAICLAGAVSAWTRWPGQRAIEVTYTIVAVGALMLIGAVRLIVFRGSAREFRIWMLGAFAIAFATAVVVTSFRTTQVMSLSTVSSRNDWILRTQHLAAAMQPVIFPAAAVLAVWMRRAAVSRALLCAAAATTALLVVATTYHLRVWSHLIIHTIPRMNLYNATSLRFAGSLITAAVAIGCGVARPPSRAALVLMLVALVPFIASTVVYEGYIYHALSRQGPQASVYPPSWVAWHALTFIANSMSLFVYAWLVIRRRDAARAPEIIGST